MPARFRKSWLALALAATLAPLARGAGAAAARLAPAPSGGAAWLGVPSGDLRESVPGLKLKTELDCTILRRVLSQTSLDLQTLRGQKPKAAKALLLAAIETQAENTLAEQRPQAGGDLLPTGEILAENRLHSRLEDMLALAGRLPSDSRLPKGLLRRLRGAEQESRNRLDALNERLLEQGAKLDAAVWRGRTAVVALPDGSALALKFSKDGGPQPLEREGGIMAETVRLGLDMPVPLAGGAGYARPAESVAGEPGRHFLPYLIPPEMARDYFSYLGDPLPDGMTREERVVRIRDASWKAIDDLSLLLKHDRFHESLAPISHSEIPWRWDYWRGSMAVISPTRFGPTSIHDWFSALSHANLRLSGIADFEHIVARNPFRFRASRGEIVGQNLTEWSLLAMRAAANNGLTAEEAVDILQEGFRRHAAASGLESRFELDFDALRRPLLSCARRFLLFHRLAAALPRFLTRISNGWVDAFIVRSIGKNEPLVMPGAVMHPLIMEAVWPYARALSGVAPKVSDQYRRVEGKDGAGWGSVLAVPLAINLLSLAVVTAMLMMPAIAFLGLPPLVINQIFLWGWGIAAVTYAVRLAASSVSLLRARRRPYWVRARRPGP
ncbi:MAG: hypothetical protein PHF00_06085 [Elusimicrobia bacterium]|nr:hypothetical protein [Elusimicrobiota bacterium]